MTAWSRGQWALRGAALAMLAVVVPAPAASQTAAEGEVTAVVERFLVAAGTHDFAALGTLFAPGASIASASLRDGRWVTASQSAEAWLAAARRAAARPYQEPVSRFTVHVDDGQLAFVRAEATLMREGQVRSRNVDYFTLLRDRQGAWKIVNGSYTAKPPD